MLGEQIIPAELDARRESLRDSVQYLELTRFRGHPQTWPDLVAAAREAADASKLRVKPDWAMENEAVREATAVHAVEGGHARGLGVGIPRSVEERNDVLVYTSEPVTFKSVPSPMTTENVTNRTVKAPPKTGQNAAPGGISRPQLALRGITWHKGLEP